MKSRGLIYRKRIPKAQSGIKTWAEKKRKKIKEKIKEKKDQIKEKIADTKGRIRNRPAPTPTPAPINWATSSSGGAVYREDGDDYTDPQYTREAKDGRQYVSSDGVPYLPLPQDSIVTSRDFDTERRLKTLRDEQVANSGRDFDNNYDHKFMNNILLPPEETEERSDRRKEFNEMLPESWKQRTQASQDSLFNKVYHRYLYKIK